MSRLGTMTIVAAALAALAGCGEDAGPGGVTAEEARQLNEAANMLDIEDASADGLAAEEDVPLGNGEEAVTEPGAPTDAPDAASSN